MEHGLLMENLLDLAHAPFTHTSTFAKGWSIPALVNFKSSQDASVGGSYPGRGTERNYSQSHFYMRLAIAYN